MTTASTHTSKGPAEIPPVMASGNTADKTRKLPERQFRSVTVERAAIDEEKRTVRLSFSSEIAVERWYGREILDHGSDSVRLERMANGPVLVQHDHRDHVGVVESASIDGRRGIAVVRFGRGARAEEVFRDIIDGIRSNVSVGYIVHRAILEEESDEGDTYRILDWEPFEVSIVAAGADATVGVGRGASERGAEVSVEIPEHLAKRNTTVGTETETGTTEGGQGMSAEEVRAAQQKATESERARCREITALGERTGFEVEARKFIEEGKSVDLFREFALDKIAENEGVRVQSSGDDGSVGLTDSEANQFSMVRLLNAMANPQDQRAQKRAGFELEVVRTASDKREVSGGNDNTVGFHVPHEVLTRRIGELNIGERAPLNVGTATAGGDLVATNLLTASFIDLLRSANVLEKLGATMLTNLVGDIAIPRQTGGATAAWISTETGDAAESNPAFDQVAMTPKVLGAFTEMTRKLLMQSSLDVEALVRRDLAIASATEISRAALYGSAASGQPRGVVNVTGIGAVNLATDKEPTWGEVVDIESEIATDNALLGTLGYALHTSMRGFFKKTVKFSNTGFTIWEPGNQLNGYDTAVSNQVLDTDLFFGNWADLLMGMWGGLDLLVDPYTKGLSGTVRVVVHQSVDVAVRHPESFCLGRDTT